MSFDPENKTDKAKLYQVLKSIAALSYGDTVDLVIDRAVGQPVPHGTDWQRNFRRGAYDSVIAQITHRWVEKLHFDLAHKVSSDIFPNAPERQWRKILDERADESRLNLVLVPSTFGVVQRESQLEKVKQVIKLGQRFGLELDSESDGYAIALQGRGDQWNVIALGPKNEAVGPIQKGINCLPKLPSGQLDPFWEDSDEGITDFVLITATTDRMPTEVHQLITWVNENECKLLRKVCRLLR